MKPPASTVTLQDFLRELLRMLEGFSEGLLSLQQGVVDELNESESSAVQKFVKTFGTHQLFIVVREFWHTRFRKALDPEPPQA